MNTLLYLITSHFLADFPLQPGWLVALKKKKLIGILIHTIVHLVVMVLLGFPLWHLSGFWWAVTVIFATHNIIDFTKIRLEKAYPKYRFPLYIADQTSHLLIILAVYITWLKSASPIAYESLSYYYTDPSVISFVLTLVLVTYFYDISRYFFLTRHKKAPYVRNYRSMGRNTLIVVIAFGVYWVTR